MALADGPPERLPSTDGMISAVFSAQESALMCHCLHKRSIADAGEISLDLHRSGDKYPRYKVYVLDQPRAREIKTYAAFIVPQGKYVYFYIVPVDRFTFKINSHIFAKNFDMNRITYLKR